MYCLDIIAETGYLGSKPVATPLEAKHNLVRDDGPFFADPSQYRRLIGRLVYLLNTRPELSFSIHLLSQFMNKPRVAHWEAALRMVRYLKGSPGQGILLRSDDDFQVNVYCDADWATCALSRRSLSAYILFVGDFPISWRTKKQDIVSHSSAESEYRSMSEACKELVWITRLLIELGFSIKKPVRLYCDNQVALHIARNPVFHERTKHIEKDCHFVRDLLKAGLIATSYVRSSLQPADIMTKSLCRPQFESLLSKLGVLDLHTPT